MPTSYHSKTLDREEVSQRHIHGRHGRILGERWWPVSSHQKRISRQTAVECCGKTHPERPHGSRGNAVGQNPLLLQDYMSRG